MALRYLVIFHRQAKPSDGRPPFAPAGLEPVLISDTVEIWCNAPADVLQTPSGRTIILGELFTRGDHPERVEALDPELDRIDAPAQHYSRTYWGRFISISRAAMGSAQIFRDPGGGLPCYVREAPERVLAFSDLGVLQSLGLPGPEVDWSAIRECLAWRGLRRSRTAFRDIYEIPQGWLLGLGGSHFSELREVWSPWNHVAPTDLPDAQLQDALRATVLGTVRALASGRNALQLSLSGGLDSSIVAAALAGTSATCFNMVADGSHGDERADASLVARHLGLELIDRRYSLADVDLDVSSAAHLPRPIGNVARLVFDKACMEFADGRGIRTLFSGFGGDNVFCYMRSVTPVVDLVHSRGAPSAIWRTMADIGRLTGTGIPAIVRHVLPGLVTPQASYPWAPDHSLLSQDAIEGACERPGHPWLEAPAGTLPGRAAHIAKLMRTQNYAEGLPRHSPLEAIHPLLSQPIMELCLSIPSWKWIEGGRERSVARSAFRSDLPPETLSRRTKGGPGAFHRQVAHTFRDEIRNRLLSGRLAAEGMLDAKAVDIALQASPDTPDFSYDRLLELCDAENWLNLHAAR